PAQDRRHGHGGQQRPDPQGHGGGPGGPGADRHFGDIAGRRCCGRGSGGGGAPGPAPGPLDEAGFPILPADLSETESIRDSLHNVDRILVGNQSTVKTTLQNFETYTASLANKGEAIDSIIGKADNAFASFDGAMAKIDRVVPGLLRGNADELYEKVKSIRELAESFNKKSGVLMEEGRRSLADISESANKVTRKFDPQGVSDDNPRPPRKPNQKRQ